MALRRLRSHARWLAMLALCCWLFGPFAEGSGLLHAHAAVDPCDVLATVHDASQHRLESTTGAPSADPAHCHACHFPRLHSANTTTVVVLALVAEAATPTFDSPFVPHVTEDGPPRSPPLVVS